MKSSEVIEALRKLHPWGPYGNPDWIFVPELRVSTGYSISEQRLDAWAMHCWPSRKFERIAYEVKVSRSDFRRELKQPEKRQIGLTLSNRFYFAAPVGVIPPFEVPYECGLVEVKEDGTARVTREAPWRNAPAPTWEFLAAVARRMLVQAGGQVRLLEEAPEEALMEG